MFITVDTSFDPLELRTADGVALYIRQRNNPENRDCFAMTIQNMVVMEVGKKKAKG